MKVTDIAKIIDIFRDDKGWYYRIFFNTIKIRFDNYNTNLFNEMYYKQGTTLLNHNNLCTENMLRLTFIENVSNLQYYFSRFANYYQITKRYSFSYFGESWYFCNIFDMEKSMKHSYHIKTGVDDITNKSYNQDIRFGWLFRFKLTGKLRNTFNSSIYIRI